MQLVAAANLPHIFTLNIKAAITKHASLQRFGFIKIHQPLLQKIK